MIAGNLCELRQRLMGTILDPNGPPIAFRSFVEGEGEPSEELLHFLQLLEPTAKKMIDTMVEIQEMPRIPQDAQCVVLLSRDRMTAWMFLFPPLYGGKEPTIEQLEAELAAQNVTYGVDQDKLKTLVRDGPCLTLIAIAAGTPAINGQDGWIKDYFPRQQENDIQKLEENEQADYRELGWVRNVYTGDIICDIGKPIDPVPGFNVQGKRLEGKKGMRPRIPQGRNTSVNEEGTALVADVDGQVSFSGEKFHVDQILTIAGNVDVSVGNLNVLGDVVVQGDVLDGFLVKATGNVSVQGMVEDATIVAGGNIYIQRGMNGNNRGSLEAGESISAKYLENCIVQAGGIVKAESIINCKVSSNDKVLVTAGRGVIIGGSITACRAVEATTIGNQFSGNTIITIGATPSFLKEKAEVEAEVHRLKKETEDMEKNLSYLDKAEHLSPEYVALQNKLRLQLSILRMRHNKAFKHLEKLDNQQRDLSGCTVRSSMIYPLTQVTIGAESRQITKPTPMCMIYKGPEGITIGTK